MEWSSNLSSETVVQLAAMFFVITKEIEQKCGKNVEFKMRKVESDIVNLKRLPKHNYQPRNLIEATHNSWRLL